MNGTKRSWFTARVSSFDPVAGSWMELRLGTGAVAVENLPSLEGFSFYLGRAIRSGKTSTGLVFKLPDGLSPLARRWKMEEQKFLIAVCA